MRSLRLASPTADELVAGIVNGNMTSLSRAITVLESTNPEHVEKASKIVSQCLPHSGKSVRIGITGVPGVGKSTFIEAFGKHLTALGKRVAVLAVDPSSTISHGSILGDKTRMEELVKDPNAYIRPSASGETLGGVARKTRETITLCEAAGFDVIIIETVGVGQSETAVHGMVDFFLLLKIAGAGDELQGIKRGIMEMADAVVINKADGENKKRATMAKGEFNRALHLFPPTNSGWTPKATTCSAITREGIEEIWNTVLEYLKLTENNGYFMARRNEQSRYWMLETINSELLGRFYSDPAIEPLVAEMKLAVGRQEISPFVAAQRLLEIYFKRNQSS
ncbi:MAG: methylmalonyl Co-A mutase-associated GTPase MeaB [Flavobacterium sp.]|nr:MAG: methylmalonyl Co-A mutase-associated GTPase MeaB [Flavobacterium sp.]